MRKKGEKECRFIRHRLKWNIQFKLDQMVNALKLSKILHENLLMVNGDNKRKQTYKII